MELSWTACWYCGFDCGCPKIIVSSPSAAVVVEAAFVVTIVTANEEPMYCRAVKREQSIDSHSIDDAAEPRYDRASKTAMERMQDSNVHKK